MQPSEEWKDVSKAWQSEFKYFGIKLISGNTEFIQGKLSNS